MYMEIVSVAEMIVGQIRFPDSSSPDNPSVIIHWICVRWEFATIVLYPEYSFEWY